VAVFLCVLYAFVVSPFFDYTRRGLAWHEL
jgi:hypothetical protein